MISNVIDFARRSPNILALSQTTFDMSFKTARTLSLVSNLTPHEIFMLVVCGGGSGIHSVSSIPLAFWIKL